MPLSRARAVLGVPGRDRSDWLVGVAAASLAVAALAALAGVAVAAEQLKNSLTGLPGQKGHPADGGDWLIRATVSQR
jgi:hypothetical protein